MLRQKVTGEQFNTTEKNPSSRARINYTNTGLNARQIIYPVQESNGNDIAVKRCENSNVFSYTPVERCENVF